MASKFKRWFKNQWDATKGNFWWALGYALFTSLGGGGMTAWVTKVFQGFAHVPPTNTMGYFIVGSLVSLVISICLLVARRRTGNTPVALSVQTDEAAPTLAPTQPKEVDIHAEIQQLHFKSNPPYTYTVFMKLKLTNRGTADATIGSWMLFLSIGKDQSQCDSLGQLPANLAIKRITYPNPFSEPVESFEQIEPNLGEQVDRNPLKRGIPQVGWICFDVAAYELEPAVNAGLTVYMMDSLGSTHYFDREGQNFKRDGELVEHEPPMRWLLPRIGSGLVS
jgi:hypothetical protein